MKELLKEERPYEKCGRFGAKSLTDIELLAVLLRSGTKGGNVLETAKKILYPSGREGRAYKTAILLARRADEDSRDW